MKKRKVTLRIAVPDDAGALVAIYAPYVLNTAVTYEYEVPSAGEFRRRIMHTLENYPYVVAEVDGEIAGYAYTGRLGVRAAFAWAAETSIYIREDMHGLGIGRKLYDALEKFSQVQHIVTLHSAIAWSEDENDPRLTRGVRPFTGIWALRKQRILSIAGINLTAGMIYCGWKKRWAYYRKDRSRSGLFPPLLRKNTGPVLIENKTAEENGRK